MAEGGGGGDEEVTVTSHISTTPQILTCSKCFPCDLHYFPSCLPEISGGEGMGEKRGKRGGAKRRKFSFIRIAPSARGTRKEIYRCYLA